MKSGDRKHWLDMLTERQMDVLIRVAQFKSSKQIARELEISHHTVDQRIRVIIAKLGVASRADAARAYLEYHNGRPVDDRPLCEDLVYQPPELAEAGNGLHGEFSSRELDPAGDGSSVPVQWTEEENPAGLPTAKAGRSWVSVLWSADRQNNLSASGRGFLILVMMLLSLMVMGALVGLAEGLSRLF